MPSDATTTTKKINAGLSRSLQRRASGLPSLRRLLRFQREAKRRRRSGGVGIRMRFLLLLVRSSRTACLPESEREREREAESSKEVEGTKFFFVCRRRRCPSIFTVRFPINLSLSFHLSFFFRTPRQAKTKSKNNVSLFCFCGDVVCVRARVPCAERGRVARKGSCVGGGWRRLEQVSRWQEEKKRERDSRARSSLNSKPPPSSFAPLLHLFEPRIAPFLTSGACSGVPPGHPRRRWEERAAQGRRKEGEQT